MARFLDRGGLAHTMTLIKNWGQEKLVSGTNIGTLVSGGNSIDLLVSPSTSKSLLTIGGNSIIGTGNIGFSTINGLSIVSGPGSTPGDIRVQPVTTFGPSFIDNDKTISLVPASSTTLGGLKTGYSADSAHEKYYPVQLDEDGNAFVNVPWVQGEPGKDPSPVGSNQSGIVPGYGTEANKYLCTYTQDGAVVAGWKLFPSIPTIPTLSVSQPVQMFVWGDTIDLATITYGAQAETIKLKAPANPTDQLELSGTFVPGDSADTLTLNLGAKTTSISIQHAVLTTTEINNIVSQAVAASVEEPSTETNA